MAKTKVRKGVHQPSRLAEWARQREMLPRDRYALGPTGLVFSMPQYWQNVVPCFLATLDFETYLNNNRDYKLFRWAAKGGLLQSIAGEKSILVVDNRHTRDTLTRIFALPDYRSQKREVRSLLLTITYRATWEEIVSRLFVLREALETPDWQTHVSDRGEINLRHWVKFGDLLDTGKLPFDLLHTAMLLSAVWLDEYLRNQHPSGGIWSQSGDKVRLMRVVHGSSKQLSRYPGSKAYISYQSAITERIPRIRIHDILKPKKTRQ